MSALDVLRQVLPVYLLIAAGAAARRLRLTKRDSDDGILRLVFNVMLPCLILDKILGNTEVRDFSSIGWGLGVGFSLTVLGFGAAWWFAGALKYQRGNGKRTFALSAGLQNYVYTALPIVQQLFGGAMTMLFVHNLGVELALWSVGIMLVSGEGSIPWKKLLNGPVIAVILGLAMVLTGTDHFVAGSLRTALSWLGVGTLPVAIFVTGSLMMDLLGHEKPSWKTSLGGIAARLVILPALILLVAKWLPMPLILKQVLLVQAAMPAAMTPILIAKLYGGRPAIAVEIVVGTTLVSALTLPLVLTLGYWWLGF